MDSVVFFSGEAALVAPAGEAFEEGLSFFRLHDRLVREDSRALGFLDEAELPEENINRDENGDDGEKNPNRHCVCVAGAGAEAAGAGVLAGVEAAAGAELVAGAAAEAVTSNFFSARTFPPESLTWNVHGPTKPVTVFRL